MRRLELIFLVSASGVGYSPSARQLAAAAGDEPAANAPVRVVDVAGDCHNVSFLFAYQIMAQPVIFAMLLEITAGDFAFARGSSSYRHQSRSRHLEFRGDSQ
jgi:hypothetical protein